MYIIIENMRLFIRENRKYFYVFLSCVLLLTYGLVEEYNLIEIINRALFEQGYIDGYFANNDVLAVSTMPHNVINVVLSVFKYSFVQFESLIVMGTRIFQLCIPLFTVVSGIEFYKYYHTIYKFKLSRGQNFRKSIFKKITLNSLKVSGAIFLAYVIYLIIIYTLIDNSISGGAEREFLLDILGTKFYTEHMFLYYMLEGSVRFLLMPFVYCYLTQAGVLYFQNMKEVIALPIVYYYLLSAIGYGLYAINSDISLYINPSVIMASGSYSNLNSIALLATNTLPLFLSILFIYWRTKNVEI